MFLLICSYTLDSTLSLSWAFLMVFISIGGVSPTRLTGLRERASALSLREPGRCTRVK